MKTNADFDKSLLAGTVTYIPKFKDMLDAVEILKSLGFNDYDCSFDGDECYLKVYDDFDFNNFNFNPSDGGFKILTFEDFLSAIGGCAVKNCKATNTFNAWFTEYAKSLGLPADDTGFKRHCEAAWVACEETDF